MGKAYRIQTSLDRLRKQQTQIKNLQAINRTSNTPRPVATTAFSGVSAAGSTGGTGNFLATQGDTMVGPIAVYPNQVLIEIDIDGIADISKNTELAYTSYVRIDVTGPTNVLDTLAGAGFDGQLVWLENVGPMTISQSTVENGGNIVTSDGNDIVFTITQVTPMIFEAALVPPSGAQGGWRVIAGGSTGGGDVSLWANFPAVSDIDFATFDGFNIDRLLFDQAVGESLVATSTGITSNASGDLLHNVPTSQFYRFSSGLVDILEIDDTTGLKMLGSHVINMNNNIINTIKELQLTTSNTHVPTVQTGIGFDSVTDSLIYNVGLTSFFHSFKAAGELLATITRVASNSGSLNVDNVVANLLQANELIDLSTFTNSTPTNGNIWLDLSTGLFQFRENGITVELGGGLTEPIILGVNTLTPQTLPTTTTIAWNTTNTHHIILDRAVEFDFTGLPPNGSYEGILIIIDIDATGGFASPIWPASLVNPPIIPTTALSRFEVLLNTIDNGTVVTHATSVGSSTGGSGTLSGLTIDVNKDWGAFGISNLGALTGVTGIDLDGATATIEGVQLLKFFQTDQQIESTSSGIMYMVGDLQEHLFKSQSDNIAQFEESSADVFRLNMLDHTIDNAKDYRLDPFASYSIPGAQPGIGFDDVNNRMRINVPTGNQVSFEENSAGIGTGVTINPASGGSVTANVINASDVLQLGIDATVPFIEGEFRNDGNDTFVFSGGAVRNLSDIGVQNSISQLDSSVTVTDSGSNGLIQFTLDSVLVAQIQNNRMDFQDTQVFGMTSLFFNDTIDVAVGTTLTQNQNDFTMNFPDNADDFIINFNSVIGFIVDKDITRVASTSPNTVGAVFELFRDDPSPTIDDVVGEVQFRGRDTAVVQNNIVYGKMGVEIENATEALSTGSFRWTLRELGNDEQMMSLREGILAVVRTSTTLAADRGAAIVLVRRDSSFTIGDEAGELDFNIQVGATETVFGNISVSFDDSTGGDDSSRMDFKLLTDDTLQNVLTIRGSALTNNLIAIEVAGESYIKAKTGVMGYFVTSDPNITDSGIIGSQGTIQIPQFSNGSPSVNDLDVAFGDFEGAIGQDIFDGKLYVKKTATVWSFYSESGTVV